MSAGWMQEADFPENRGCKKLQKDVLARVYGLERVWGFRCFEGLGFIYYK